MVLNYKTICIVLMLKVEKGNLKGLRDSRNGLCVSHLFFADDSTFFLQGIKDNCRIFKNILDAYCKASGQIVNHEKSLMFASPNMDEQQVNEIKEMVSFNMSKNFGICLGLPADFSTNKRSLFAKIIDKANERLNAWNSLFLSPA